MRLRIALAALLCASFLLPLGAPAWVDGAGTDFIQPGRHLIARPPTDSNSGDGDSTCSIGFILQHETTGRYYALTAGHCLNLGKTATSHMWWTDTPLLKEDWGVAVYHNVVRDHTNLEVLVDHVLIDIDDDHQDDVNASIPVFGGPTGVADVATLSVGTPIGHYGLPSTTSTATGLARAGIFAGADGTEVTYHAAAVPGDSGSPVIELLHGHALSIHSGTNISPTADGPGVKYGISLASALADLEANGWTGLRLVTAPLSDFTHDAFAE